MCNFHIANIDNIENALEPGNRANNKLIKIIQRVFKNIFRKSASIFVNTTKSLICTVSGFLMQNVIDSRKNGAPVEKIANFLETVCTTFRIEPKNVCVGAIDLNIVSSFNFHLHLMLHSLISIYIP